DSHPKGLEIGQIAAHYQDKADCLIIMGTSLRIPRAKAFIKDFAKAVHERNGYMILVNATNVVTKEWNGIIDYQIEGTYDVWVGFVGIELSNVKFNVKTTTKSFSQRIYDYFTGSKAKVNKLPRLPDSFILYRRKKQPDIMAKNSGISNNELSFLMIDTPAFSSISADGENPIMNRHNQNIQQQRVLQTNLKIPQNTAAPCVVVVNKLVSTVGCNINSTTTPSNVRSPQLASVRAAAPIPRGGTIIKFEKPRRPPRPPNAFILYRRSKQPDIVAANKGISNKEVSILLGKMWHKESLEEKTKFQCQAEAEKLEHMKKYPGYKFHPRRPHEICRRTKKLSVITGNNGTTNAVKNSVKKECNTLNSVTNSEISNNSMYFDTVNIADYDIDYDNVSPMVISPYFFDLSNNESCDYLQFNNPSDYLQSFDYL
ncbi:8980_t:CDS:2, partial [Dentiscutata erythropus]